MKLLLSGGGTSEKTILVNKKFNEIIDHTKPLLFIPLARYSTKYPSSIEWIKNELKNVDIPDIEMITKADEICNKDLNNYCGIFIGGGNTFKLLSELKECDAFNILKDYIKNGGIVYGCSAGAIIFGYDISSCLYNDSNDVNLKDTKGFNILNGKSITAHYTNKNEEKTKLATDYLIEYTKNNEEVYALPEEDTIYVNDNKIKIIGTKDYHIFKNGNIFKKSIDIM